MFAFNNFFIELIVIIFLGFVFANADNDDRLQLHPNETTVFVGDSVIFYCSKEKNAPSPVDWYHIPVGKKDKIHIYKSAINELYITESGVNYQTYMSVDYNASTGEYNLLIRNVSKAYAGTYFCVDTEVEQTTKKTELIVIDSPPTCQTNVSGEGALGENSCDIPPDYIEFNCSIRYHGNVAPVLELYHDIGVGNDTRETRASKVIRYDNGIPSIVIMASLKSNGTFFHCRFKNLFPLSNLGRTFYECNSSVVKILYATNSSESYDVASKEGVSSCSIKTNSELCRYRWRNQVESRETIIHSRDLLHNDLQLLGSYLCLADCSLKGKMCTLRGQRVGFVAEYEYYYKWAVVAIVFVCLFIITLSLLVKVTVSKNSTSKKAPAYVVCELLCFLKYNFRKITNEEINFHSERLL